MTILPQPFATAPEDVPAGSTVQIEGQPFRVGQDIRTGEALAVDERGLLVPAGPAAPSLQEPQDAPLTERELATRLLVIAALQDRVKAVDATLRREFRERATVGDRTSGILDPSRKETKLGTVTLAEGAEYVSVKDDAAFFAWVMENYPDEIQNVPTVNAAFRTAVLDAVKRDDGWPDPETGELVEVPGVEKRVGDPTPKVVKAKGVDLGPLLTEAIASGKLKEITA